jgi:hypothetical protein
MRNMLLKILAFLAIALVASSAFARTEPNAFLNKPAPTHAALMYQIKSDTEVMSRFTRHFGMTREEVIAFFGTLRLDTLKEDGTYLVYNVPESGELRAKTIFYRKGTKVWVDQNGGIVLKESCGNPMMRGTDNQSVVVEAGPTGELIAANREVATPDPTPAAAVATVAPIDLEASAASLAPVAPAAPLVSRGASSFNPAFLLPLAAAPLLVQDSNPEPIPEPATMTVLALGALAALRRKKAKN